MKKEVAPLCRLHENSQSDLPAQTSSSGSPCRSSRDTTRRTRLISGLAQRQLEIARPSKVRSTQLASTAPPSMGTQPPRQATDRAVRLGTSLTKAKKMGLIAPPP
jgi:hypothetical protein